MNEQVHFLYETTNLINGKKYIGMHSTKNIDDGYLGSGILLSRAMAKYGRENFTRKILCFNETAELNAELESLIIDESITKNSMYYNIAGGGQGGAGVAALRTPEHFAAAAAKKRGRTKENDAGVAAQAEKQSAYMQNGGIEIMVSKRKGRTKETCAGIAAQAAKMSGDNSPMKHPARRAHQSECMAGEKNPSFGKFGEHATNSKLTDLERADIISSFEGGVSRPAIAEKYKDKVGTGTIQAFIKKSIREGAISKQAEQLAKLKKTAPNAKLTDAQRLEIIRLFEGGMRGKEIAIRYADLVRDKAIYTTIQKREYYKLKLTQG